MAENPNAPVVSPSLEKYAKCFALTKGTNFSNIFDGTLGTGTARLNPERLRCVLLTELQKGVEQRVLDLDNYIDCRMPPGKLNKDEIINEALAAYGSSADASFIYALTDAIADAQESGDSANLGPLERVLSSIGDPQTWPRAGSYARVGSETAALLGLKLSDILLDTIARYFPGFPKDNVDKAIRLLVDTLFFVGDYVAEAMALREEMAQRLISYNAKTDAIHPYGIGRVNTIRGAYKATYGTGASMVTVREWCRVGADRGAPYTAPDGTDGRYQEKLRAWKFVTDGVKGEAARIGMTPIEIIGTSNIIASLFVIHDAKSARSILDTIYGDFRSANADLVVNKLPSWYTPSGENVASTLVKLDPNAAFATRDYYVPFWLFDPSSALAAFTGPSVNRGSTVTDRTAYRLAQIEAFERLYALRRLPRLGEQGCVSLDGATCSSQSTPTEFSFITRRGDFAKNVVKVWDMWIRYMRVQYPYVGPRTLYAKIRDQMLANFARSRSTFDNLWKGLGGAFEKNFTKENALYLILTGSYYAPTMPTPEMFPSPKGPCPDGTTSCIPCDVIKSRRPIGAKAIQIPQFIEWGGDFGPKLSPEFGAWKRALSDAGYPGYYIDCLAKDLTFKAKPGAKLFPSSRSPIRSDIPVINPIKLSGMRGASGLRAPSVALLSGGLGIREFLPSSQTPSRGAPQRFDSQGQGPTGFRLIDDVNQTNQPPPADLADQAGAAIDRVKSEAEGLHPGVKALLAVGLGLAIVKALK